MFKLREDLEPSAWLRFAFLVQLPDSLCVVYLGSDQTDPIFTETRRQEQIEHICHHLWGPSASNCHSRAVSAQFPRRPILALS